MFFRRSAARFSSLKFVSSKTLASSSSQGCWPFLLRLGSVSSTLSAPAASTADSRAEILSQTELFPTEKSVDPDLDGTHSQYKQHSATDEFHLVFE
jgi:hypothetical protein